MLKPFLLFSIALIGAACSKPEAENTLILSGSSTTAPLVSELAKVFEKQREGAHIVVRTGGSTNGIEDARSGRVDIGMASRALRPGEDGLIRHTLATGGIAVILHEGNSVKNLTREQLVSIYTGKTANWSDLGGPNREIVAVNKAKGRGTLEQFMKFLQIDASKISAHKTVGENRDVIAAVAENNDAIGYVSVSAAEAERVKGAPIELIRVNGIQASSETVADSSYPISCPLILVTRGEPTGLAKDFIDFARSGEAHPLILGQLFYLDRN